MSKHNSKVLKVYQQCETVLKLKRKFVQEISIPSLPSIQNSKQFNGVKDYCTVHFIQIAVANFFKESEQNYSKYKQQASSKKSIQNQIEFNIKKIKNTKDLTLRHEQLQHELDESKKQWQKEDPLVYYEVNERIKFKNTFKEKFTQFKESQSGLKTIKNPHFVHKLINQLKQNLEQISLQDKQYDLESEENTQKISRYLRDLTKEMELNIENIRYRNFIFEQKKKLFSQFVDINDSPGKSLKNSKNSNVVRHYFEELLMVSKDIKEHYKKLMAFVEYLIGYFKQVYTILKQESVNVEKKYQNFIEQVFKNKEIRVILRIDIQERINNNLRMILSLCQIMKGIPVFLENYKISLIECYNEANNYHERYITKQLKFKDTTDSFEKMLIEHKGYFSSLEKKEQKYNEINIQNLRKFVRDIYEMMKIIYQQNMKSSRVRTDIPLHDMINKIFAEYNFAQEKNQLSDSQSTSSETKDLNLQAKIKQFEKFIDSIEVFDSATINWSNMYFACSLGPKLLIHGYMQVLESGIYYESSFNKKNYFFGKTKIFVPKSDIYEVNKQKALLVFPDVIQIKANKGQIYLHALGKRDRMYDQLISVYFPEVPETQNAGNGEPQIEFNEFKGQNTQDRTAYKLTPYAIDFGQAILKNCDLRVIFRRYFSDDSFTYQGKQYQNFKCYQLQRIGGGLNSSANQLTPPPPYYFMKKGEPMFSEAVPDFSIRMATFQKKIPIIPFISKGGNSLCEQKSIYYWGGPDFFVIQIENTMKGFKLTEGMTIRIRLFYRQDKEKNQVRCSTSAEIVFATQGALTGTIKTQALAQTKNVIQKTVEIIQKNEKNRSVYKNKGNNIQQNEEEKEQYMDEIQKLKDQNRKLNQKLKIFVALFLLIYVLTILWMKMGLETHFENGKMLIDREEYLSLKQKNNSQKVGFWPFN